MGFIANLLPKSLIKSVTKSVLKKYVTREMIVNKSVLGINSLLSRIENRDRLGNISVGVEAGSALFGTISRAIKDGVVTVEEANEIATTTADLTGIVFTQEKIDELIDTIVEKI